MALEPRYNINSLSLKVGLLTSVICDFPLVGYLLCLTVLR